MRLGIAHLDMVANPVKRIQFSIDIRPRAIRKVRDSRRRGVVNAEGTPEVADRIRRSVSRSLDGTTERSGGKSLTTKSDVSDNRVQMNAAGEPDGTKDTGCTTAVASGAAGGPSFNARSGRVGSRVGSGGNFGGGSGRHGAGPWTNNGNWRGSGSGGIARGWHGNASHQHQSLASRFGNVHPAGISNGRGGPAAHTAMSHADVDHNSTGDSHAPTAPVSGGRFVHPPSYILPLRPGPPPLRAQHGYQRVRRSGHSDGHSQLQHPKGGGAPWMQHHPHHQYQPQVQPTPTTPPQGS